MGRHEARRETTRNAYKVLVDKLEVKRQLGRRGPRSDNDMNVALK
jgi:hypothetical protein